MKSDRTPILTMAKLTTMTRATWPEYQSFDAATYYNWPGPAAYLYPHVTPKLSPEGAMTPVQLLQALVAKGVLRATSYVLLVTEDDLRRDSDVG